VRSGIADYTADLLPFLAERPEIAELRVMHLPGQPVSDDFASRWHPVPAAETGDDGRLPLYQMGNNQHHEGVLELAMERPGVLILHDLVLHHLLVERTLSRGVFEPYAEALERDHGWVGAAVAGTRRWAGYTDGGVFALPAHRTLLRRQRGVLVHSAWAAGVVAEEDPEIAVRAIPMAVPLPAAAGPPGGEAARAARRAFGLPEEAHVLGSFGFQTPIKRTAAAVRALARPELAGVHLLVVGEVSPQVDLDAAAAEAGVADRVHVTGFVDYDRFEQGLAACDLALNLRYPTAGETSASLLRLLAAGRGAVVSDYAQFRDLPPAAVARVPLGDPEEAELAAVCGALLSDPARLAAMGAAARAHVAAEHDPERAAAAVAAACAELAEREPPGDRPATAPPASSAAARHLGGVLAVEGLDRPWPAGERRRLTVRVTNSGDSRWLATRRGPGGVAFVVALETEEGDGGTVDLAAGHPWLALPRDLAPGEEAVLPLDLRRPPGPARLALTPLVLDGWSGERVTTAGERGLQAPCWVGELP